MNIEYISIGIIHSPFQEIAGMPIQPTGARGVKGDIEIYPEFVAGLEDLLGFSHLFLIYHFHRVKSVNLQVMPFLDKQPRGIFSTRAPTRPNPIGLSVVKLIEIEESILRVENVDILDGTPLLDIKPCIPRFDHPKVERIGWLEGVDNEVSYHRSDQRFESDH